MTFFFSNRNSSGKKGDRSSSDSKAEKKEDADEKKDIFSFTRIRPFHQLQSLSVASSDLLHSSIERSIVHFSRLERLLYHVSANVLPCYKEADSFKGVMIVDHMAVAREFFKNSTKLKGCRAYESKDDLFRAENKHDVDQEDTTAFIVGDANDDDNMYMDRVIDLYSDYCDIGESLRCLEPSEYQYDMAIHNHVYDIFYSVFDNIAHPLSTIKSAKDNYIAHYNVFKQRASTACETYTFTSTLPTENYKGLKVSNPTTRSKFHDSNPLPIHNNSNSGGINEIFPPVGESVRAPIQVLSDRCTQTWQARRLYIIGLAKAILSQKMWDLEHDKKINFCPLCFECKNDSIQFNLPIVTEVLIGGFFESSFVPCTRADYNEFCALRQVEERRIVDKVIKGLKYLKEKETYEEEAKAKQGCDAKRATKTLNRIARVSVADESGNEIIDIDSDKFENVSKRLKRMTMGYCRKRLVYNYFNEYCNVSIIKEFEDLPKDCEHFQRGYLPSFVEDQYRNLPVHRNLMLFLVWFAKKHGSLMHWMLYKCLRDISLYLFRKFGLDEELQGVNDYYDEFSRYPSSTMHIGRIPASLELNPLKNPYYVSDDDGSYEHVIPKDKIPEPAVSETMVPDPVKSEFVSPDPVKSETMVPERVKSEFVAPVLSGTVAPIDVRSNDLTIDISVTSENEQCDRVASKKSPRPLSSSSLGSTLKKARVSNLMKDDSTSTTSQNFSDAVDIGLARDSCSSTSKAAISVTDVLSNLQDKHSSAVKNNNKISRQKARKNEKKKSYILAEKLRKEGKIAVNFCSTPPLQVKIWDQNDSSYMDLTVIRIRQQNNVIAWRLDGKCVRNGLELWVDHNDIMMIVQHTSIGGFVSAVLDEIEGEMRLSDIQYSESNNEGN